MSVELISVLIAVLAIGATLGGLILTGNRGLRQDMRQDMAQLESRLRDDIKQLGDRVGRLEHGQAKLAWPELNYSTAPGLLILHPSTPTIAPLNQDQLPS